MAYLNIEWTGEMTAMSGLAALTMLMISSYPKAERYEEDKITIFDAVFLSVVFLSNWLAWNNVSILLRKFLTVNSLRKVSFPCSK